jgi:hypothetical protein
VWLDVDLLWFGDRAAPAVGGLTLPPLPTFGPQGLAASRERRAAWKRRRRARAAALVVLPAVVVPPALARANGGAKPLLEDPPSLTSAVDSVRLELAGGSPAASAARRSAPDLLRPAPAPPAIAWRNATSRGLWWSGTLVDGTPLPIEGPDWVTWNPNTNEVPNQRRRLYANERTIRAVLSALAAYRVANPRAPRVVIGDLSFDGGGPMDAHVSHQNGLDVDVYYPRRDGTLREPHSPRQIDLRLAQDLLDRFLAAGAEIVFVGYSTGLRGPEDVVVPYPRHENHMHVRFAARA